MGSVKYVFLWLCSFFLRLAPLLLLVVGPNIVVCLAAVPATPFSAWRQTTLLFLTVASWPQPYFIDGGPSVI